MNHKKLSTDMSVPIPLNEKKQSVLIVSLKSHLYTKYQVNPVIKEQFLKKSVPVSFPAE